MPFDLIAFYESQACAALTALAGVADRVYRVSGDDIYVKPRAPFLAGLFYGAPTHDALKYSELRQPSLKVPYRSYITGDINQDNGFNWLNLFANPLPLYPDEKLNAYVQNATNEAQHVVAWLSSGAAKIADLENVSPTHLITGYADQALSAGVWTDVTITWDQDLPIGRYAVVGMKVASYKASGWYIAAARMRLLDSTWRPGVLARHADGDKLGIARNYPGTYDFALGERWPLMQEISFRHDQMPNLEMFCGAANTDHIVNLLLQKIG